MKDCSSLTLYSMITPFDAFEISCIRKYNGKIAIRGDGKSPDQKVIDMQLQAANLVYIFDVIILSVTANKSGRLTVETSFLPLNSSKGGNLKAIMPAGDTPREKIQKDS